VRSRGHGRHGNGSGSRTSGGVGDGMGRRREASRQGAAELGSSPKLLMRLPTCNQCLKICAEKKNSEWQIPLIFEKLKKSMKFVKIWPNHVLRVKGTVIF
jgi:hypothetical protein